MSTDTTPTVPEQQQPPSPQPQPQTPARRTVTLPVLPLAIVSAVLIAILFFGGGVALGYGVALHPGRGAVIQPFERNQGGQYPFGGNRGNGGNGGLRPGTPPTGAPSNG